MELQNGSVDLALDKILRVYITAALHSENSLSHGAVLIQLQGLHPAQIADSIIVNGDKATPPFFLRLPVSAVMSLVYTADTSQRWRTLGGKDSVCQQYFGKTVGPSSLHTCTGDPSSVLVPKPSCLDSWHSILQLQPVYILVQQKGTL